jgi:hypothetical protein
MQRVCREVERREACTATRFPPTPFMTGWNTAMPFHRVTAKSRMSPPAELSSMESSTGTQPCSSTSRVPGWRQATHLPGVRVLGGEEAHMQSGVSRR